MKILFLIGLMIGSLNAQTLKISNGITASRLGWKLNTFDSEMYDKYVSNYSISMGAEWMKYGIWNISSSVGYIRKGGKNIEIQTDQLGEPIGTQTDIAKLDYLSLNTTADVDLTLSNKFALFGGGGPRIDILIANNKIFDELDEMYILNPITFGLLLEAGIKYQNSRYEIGLKGDYFLNINKIAEWPTTEINSGGRITERTFGLSLVLGYKL